MNRYLESGNLIVRTDSYDKCNDKCNELSEHLLKKKDEEIKVSIWKKVITGNNNDTKNLEKHNFPQL